MDEFLSGYLDCIGDIDACMRKGYALFGAGRAAIAVLRYFKSRDLAPECFIDNDPKKVGKSIDGVPIVTSTDPTVRGLQVVIATPRGGLVDWPPASELFKGKHLTTFDKYYCLSNYEKIYSLYNSVFVDKTSKQTLKNIVLANVSGNNKYYVEAFIPNQYYCIPEFMGRGNEYMADIGAFVGDSLERFIWAYPEFKKIYAFEPGKKQYLAMKKRIERLKAEWALSNDQITVVNCAIGEKHEVVSTGQSSGLSNFSLNSTANDEQIETISLDAYFENRLVSFLKADIEGAEVQMLRGASKLLAAQKPKLAVCTYHHVSDLVDIMDLINDVGPYANMALRHHSYNFTESVLYCWD